MASAADRRQPRVLGLLGGIASGKSAVARLLAERGFRVLDADRLAREVLEAPELRPALLELLGTDIEAPGGGLDRTAIAEQVFAHPGLRERLEGLVHPPVRSRLVAELDRHLAAGDRVVLDIPLLLEKGLIERCDRVVFVDCRDAVRRERALARGMTEADWRRRESVQAPLGEKRRRADLILDNSESLEETAARLDAWLDRGFGC